MSKEPYFCRFEGYWCVECCESRPCCNLGKLQDGTRGCPGYYMKEGEKIDGVFPISDICKVYDCLKNRSSEGVKLDTPEMYQKIYEKIKERPAGEYKMYKDIVKPILADLRKL